MKTTANQSIKKKNKSSSCSRMIFISYNLISAQGFNNYQTSLAQIRKLKTLECLLHYVFKLMKKLQNAENEKHEDNNQSKAITLALIVMAIRATIFLLGYQLRQLNYTPSLPIALSSCSLFVALEIGYWIKASKEDLTKVRKILTIILHLWSFGCFLGIGLTVNYNEIEPSGHYFLFECSLICNYSLSLLYFYRLYTRPPPSSDFQKFLNNNDLSMTIAYLFFSMYLGAFFDTLAFDKQSSLIFAILNIILVLYLIAAFLKSKTAILFKQGYLSQ